MLRNKLRTVRETLGLSQDDLAKGSGVSVYTIRNLEDKVGWTCQDDVKIRLCRFLHMDLGALFWIEDEPVADRVA